jgi:tripartite-type tricarboxylate transporter receptor subunit TctC
VVKAAPDGFTLLMSSASPLVINPVIFRKLPHDPLKQLAPVSHVGIAPAAFLVNSATAVTNLKELVALAKAQPKKLSYGSFGQGSGAHLAIEAFNQSAGIDMIHVPYKGTGPAVSDLIAGQITLTLADLATAQSQIKAGKLRAIAINGPSRSPLLPDVATFTEQAYPAMEGTYARFGLLAPVGIPQVILNKVSADTITALNDPMVSDRFTSLGYTLTGSTPDKLRNWLKEDAERWGKVIQAIGGIVLD